MNVSSACSPEHFDSLTKGPAVPWVRVIIVNYNGGKYLQPCVEALAKQTMADFEAIIVDNASTDGSAEGLHLPDPRFTLVQSGKNLGFAAANNLAARNCLSPWIATLNPDTEAHVDWLAEMRSGVDRFPNARMFGATLINAVNRTTVDGFGDVLSIAGIAWRGGNGWPIHALPNQDCEVFAPCAAAALYCREAFEASAGFDDRFFCYLEDVDLGFRLRLAGFKCVQLRNSIVYHYSSAITGAVSPFTIYYSYRNRILLILKNMPSILVLISLCANIGVSGLVLFRRRRIIPVKSALCGIRDGFRGGIKLRQARMQVQSTRQISTISIIRILAWRIRARGALKCIPLHNTFRIRT